MAYDANSAYQAPGRAYYGQMQNGYTTQAQAQYNDFSVQQPYDEPYQGYDQPYANSNGYQDPRAVQSPQSPQASSHNAYYDNQRNAQQTNGYGAQQQQAERQYDPRYQQRQERGRQLNPGQSQQQQPPAQQQQRHDRGRDQRRDQHIPVMGQHPTYDQAPRPQHHVQQQPLPDTQFQMQQSRPNPRNARNYTGQPPPQPQQQQNFNAQSIGLPNPPRIGDADRPRSAPQPEKRQPDPAKMTMEEWKAKEKAKMQAEAVLPDTIAWDNAFPVFPTTRDRSKNRGGNESARGSAELSRPGTSSGARHERTASKSRAYSDSNQASGPDTFQQQPPPQRPPLDHKPHSADQVVGRPGEPTVPSSQPPLKTWTSKYFVSNPDAPQSQERTSPQPPIPEQQRSEQPPARSEWKQPPSQIGHLSHRPDNQPPRNVLQEQPYVNRRPSPVELPAIAPTPPPPAGAATQRFQPPSQSSYQSQSFTGQAQAQRQAPPPIDPRQAMQAHVPAYMDHQPLSPASVPPRPSTSHGNGQRSPGLVSPLSESMATPPLASTAQMPQNLSRGGPAEAQQPWVGQQISQDSRTGTYGQYRNNTVSPLVTSPAVAAPPTRAQEIESEMPDFDSGAPGGTSLLHKRSQPFREAPASNPPPMPAMNSQDSSWVARGTDPTQQQQQFQPQPQQAYGQQYGQPAMSPTEQQWLQGNQGPPTNGHVYGRPGQNNPRQYGASYDPRPPPQQNYQERRPPQPPFANEQPRRSMDDARQMSNQEQRPPQPPFANEQPRRSMDDARQMPYRQGPPSAQRPPMSGALPNGVSNSLPNGVPRQHRSKPKPGNDRNFPDLSVQTSWSEAPPRNGVGSAPPGQQNFRPPPQGMDISMQQSRQVANAGTPGPPVPQQRRSDPDSLPQHPMPVRPGHLDHAPSQSAKPMPVRHHNNVPPVAHQRQASASIGASSRPVTAAELEQLRAAVDANPNDQKRAMLLVKKLVEASTVLAADGGRADPRTQAQNRERYIMDADKRLRKLVASGNADAQFYLADCYGQGTMGLPVNPKEAFTLYQAAAKAGHPQAAYRTAMCCEMGPTEGGTTKDYGKAAQWYRRGAALGDPDAMFKIGIILLKGLLGQPKNIGEAVNFLKRAVEQSGSSNPQALFELAQLYESSQTNPEIRNKVVSDDRYALELFQQAGHAGHKASQFRLGQAFEYGNISAQIDNRSSITWYTKAAAQGEHQAELALSGWYLTGADGILKQSDTEAYLWARKAAASEPPIAKAMFAMGYFTETGIGCPKSIDEAKKWYARAANYRFPKAQERLHELQRSGSKASRPVNGKLSRKDQKKDEENCVVM